MKTWVRKTLSVGVLAAGALLFAPGAAHAGGHQVTGDNNGILNGNQIAVPIRVPVNIVGNGLGILGEANATGVGVNHVESGHVREHGWHDVQSTGDNNGIANGNQVYLPISVPVNVVGNAAAIAGEANTAGVGVNKVESAHTTEGWWPSGGGIQSTGDNNGILNGNQLYAPISIPINACGNSIALLGGAYSQALCANDVWVNRRGGHWKESGHVTEGGWQSVGDNNGILNGNQLYAPISLPVNLSGNAIALLGEANTHSVSVNHVESGPADGFLQSTGDNNGILNGNQFAVPINVPINVCGNALGILGEANAAAACMNGHAVFVDPDRGHDCHDACWDGDHGHKGHGPQGHGHGNGNGNGHDNAGDHGDQGSYLGDHGAQGNGADAGYGQAAADDSGYGTKPAHGHAGANKYGDAGDGARQDDESSPVAGLTETVSDSGLGGLGLLNSLR